MDEIERRSKTLDKLGLHPRIRVKCAGAPQLIDEIIRLNGEIDRLQTSLKKEIENNLSVPEEIKERYSHEAYLKRKTCAACGINKSISDYHKNGKSKQGRLLYASYCKPCNTAKKSAQNTKRLRTKKEREAYLNDKAPIGGKR